MVRPTRATRTTKKAAQAVPWAVPPDPVRRYDWVAIAEQLRGSPLEWARVFEQDRTSLVNAIRQGGIVALRPELGFEVRTTNNTRTAPRTCSLYMRYNPDKEGT